LDSNSQGLWPVRDVAQASRPPPARHPGMNIQGPEPRALRLAPQNAPQLQYVKEPPPTANAAGVRPGRNQSSPDDSARAPPATLSTITNIYTIRENRKPFFHLFLHPAGDRQRTGARSIAPLGSRLLQDTAQGVFPRPTPERRSPTRRGGSI
jgi:hypothetical protein